MKYEAVFGLQYWFNTGPEDAEFIGESTEHKKYFYKNIIAGESYEYFNTRSKTWVKHEGYPVNLFLAARRIVEETPKPEPKRWTAEDKNAGRLPEVGAEVQFNFYQSAVMRQGVIKYIDDQVVVIQTEDVTRPFCYETCKVVFTPTETQEEKAERQLKKAWSESFHIKRFTC